MSRQINQPSNQIKLTNVSIVRLRKTKKRFEIACYKNKVLEFRQGIESDIDQVLQISQVFLNVSKGQTAPKSDLDKAFGKGVGLDKIVAEILKKGEIQVGEGERREELDRIKAEVISMVTSKVVDPRTKVVYNPQIIEQALDLLMRESGKMKDEAKKAREKKDKDKDKDAGTTPTKKTKHATKSRSKKAKAKAAAAAAAAAANSAESAAESAAESGDSADSAHAAHPTDAPTNAPADALAEEKDVEAGDTDEATEQVEKLTIQPKSIWTGVVATKSSKVQALDAIRALITHQPIPVMRARLRVQINAPSNSAKAVTKEKIMAMVEEKVSEEFVNGGAEWEMVGFVDPGAHKHLEEILSGKEFRGRGKVVMLGEAEAVED